MPLEPSRSSPYTDSSRVAPRIGAGASTTWPQPGATTGNDSLVSRFLPPKRRAGQSKNVEPELNEAPITPAPTGDELLAELRRAPTRETPRPQGPKPSTTLDITLEEATTLYAALHVKIAQPPKPKPGSGNEEIPPQMFGQWLDLLENQARRMTETHPFGRKKPRHVRLELLAWEAGYLKRMVRNKRRDEARKDATYNALKAEAAERREGLASAGRRPSSATFPDPSKTPGPDVTLAFYELEDALDSCPRGLELAYGLEAMEGNVSRVARYFSQPQRTVAHAVTRLRKHLLAKGYTA